MPTPIAEWLPSHHLCMTSHPTCCTLQHLYRHLYILGVFTTSHLPSCFDYIIWLYHIGDDVHAHPGRNVHTLGSFVLLCFVKFCVAFYRVASYKKSHIKHNTYTYVQIGSLLVTDGVYSRL